MNQFIKTVILKVMLVLVVCPLTTVAEENDQAIESNEEHTDPYLATTDYTLEKYSGAPPVITVHFDHCTDSKLAREKRMTKGILIGNDHILAPADYFVDPCASPIVLPENPPQRSNNYYCHDQRIKKISHISLILENKPEAENDEVKQRAKLAAPRIVRVLNELNFDGTSTIDALLCHKIENGVIRKTPSLAVLSLSKRGVNAIPAEIETAELYTGNSNALIDSSTTSRSLLLRNLMHFHNDKATTEPDYQKIKQLVEIAWQLQRLEESKNNKKFDSQPVALVTSSGNKHYLNAIVNNWEIIDEFPFLYDLPGYAQRHPYASMIWKGTSPFTGTISHTLGMQSIPSMTGAATGLLATIEIASTATFFYYVATNYLSSSIPVYTILSIGLGFIAANGFYRWTTSEY